MVRAIHLVIAVFGLHSSIAVYYIWASWLQARQQLFTFIVTMDVQFTFSGYNLYTATA